jgi:hypothetical protein
MIRVHDGDLDSTAFELLLQRAHTANDARDPTTVRGLLR